MTLAIFGITNDTLNLIVTLLVFFLVIIWLALVYYTYADASRRIIDRMLALCATVAAFIFPYVGTIVWMIVRPPEYLDDVHERELEIRAAEVRLEHAQGGHCPHCDRVVEESYLRCPYCTRRLKDACGQCGKPLNAEWKVCPHCEAPVGRGASIKREDSAARTTSAAAANAASEANYPFAGSEHSE